MRLGVDYAATLSCYDPDAAGRACGRCDSCQLRRKGFAEAGDARCLPLLPPLMRSGQRLADAFGFGDVRHRRHPAYLVAVGI